VICGIICCGKFISTFVPTVVVSTVRKYRFNTYLFPTVDCVITVYAENGRPARYVELLKCLEEVHGIHGKRSLDSGLDAGIKDGYIEAVPMGGRRGYIPTPEGVVHTAIYIALRDVIDDVPSHAFPFLIECVRASLVTVLVPRLTLGTPEHHYLVRYLINELEFILTFGEQGELVDLEVGFTEQGRRIMFELFVALKMLAGIKVMGLEPRYYSDVKKAIVRSVNLWLMPRRLSRPELVRLFIDACRNTVTRIAVMTR
jgi:hypothetical protein